MATGKRVLVTGAGGFIGHHLVSYLRGRGYWVRGVDLKEPEYAPTQAHEFELLDLRRWDNCLQATRGVEEVYGLAANMGGIHREQQGTHHARQRLHQSAYHRGGARERRAPLPVHLERLDLSGLPPEVGERDAPQGGGCLPGGRNPRCALPQHLRAARNLRRRARDVPGRHLRKVALAASGDDIEVWGDGEQTGSYCYISDCVEGIYRLMRSDHREPINLGQDRMVSVNQLVDIVAAVAGKRIGKRYDVTKPQGVRGRNSDNTRLRRVLEWEPRVSLEEGLEKTYAWIREKLIEEGRIST